MRDNRRLDDSAFFEKMANMGWKDVESSAYTESRVYSVYNNSYLSKKDLAMVEIVYSLPHVAFCNNIIFLWIFCNFNFFLSWVLAALASVLIRYARNIVDPNNKTILIAGSLLVGKTSSIFQIIVALYTLYFGLYLKSIYCVLAVFAIPTFLSPAMFMDSRERGMAVQWKIAKRILKIELPFEKYLPKSDQF